MKLRFTSALAGAVALLTVGCMAEPDAVTVFAAASLRETVEEIAAAWTRETGRPVRCQFDGTSNLARQIEAGARADVFLPAAPEWLDRIDVLERFDWLTNRLVLVVPADGPGVDLRALDGLALAGEQVPAGAYARAALESLGIDLPPRVVYGSSVRDVLAKVSRGGAPAGIVYATDARIDPGVRIAFEFPPESHPPIVYPAALLSSAGREFFDALREPEAARVARAHGFETIR